MTSGLSTSKNGGPAIGGAFDSHAHFGDDWRAVLARAREAGMAGLVAVGCDDRTNAFALAVATAEPEFARLALGFDYSSGLPPDEAETRLRRAFAALPTSPPRLCTEYSPSLASLGSPLSEGAGQGGSAAPAAATVPPLSERGVTRSAFPTLPPSERGVARSAGGSTPCVASATSASAAGAPLRAIGEIGLDYSHEGADPAAQRPLFERQVALAAEWRLPVIVHSREAAADTVAALRAAGSPGLSAEGRLGVLHCFVGDRAFAEEVLALGMMVSFSGIVTFRNAESLRAVAATIPGDRILVETDCPYLAPVPLRGRPNEPAFVSHTIRRLAELRGVSPEELADQTRRNALRLFGG